MSESKRTLPPGLVVFKCDKCGYKFSVKTTDHDSSFFEECSKCGNLCEHETYLILIESKDELEQ